MTHVLSTQYESHYGHKLIGLDEAGCGPWAGPVVAGAVWFDAQKLDPTLLSAFNDSKKLTAKRRAVLFDAIKNASSDVLVWGVGQSSVEEIDQMNIRAAALLAMTRAYDNLMSRLSFEPSMVLADGLYAPKLPYPSKPLVDGDALCPSIAAASIIAKETRDHIMRQLDQEFPGYGWAQNAGYGTRAHQDGLMALGVTPHHRRSFAPIKRLLAEAV